MIIGVLVGIWIIIGSCLELIRTVTYPLGYTSDRNSLNLIMDAYRKKHPEEYELIT